MGFSARNLELSGYVNIPQLISHKTVSKVQDLTEFSGLLKLHGVLH
jgi:hypothetical protein